jgi:NAD(P)-dependent dehydrogenase (short-subunit alcohol dehydrogenase family)
MRVPAIDSDGFFRKFLSLAFNHLSHCRGREKRQMCSHSGNNSGVYEFTPIEAITEDQFHKVFNVNVLDLLLTTQAAVKHLSEGASIINIGSVAKSHHTSEQRGLHRHQGRG